MVRTRVRVRVRVRVGVTLRYAWHRFPRRMWSPGVDWIASEYSR